MTWKRFTISPQTIKVLGSNVKDTDPMWTGLNLARADLLIQATMMMCVCGHDVAPFDLHLSVPWCHPEDQTGTDDDWNDCYYRVRPKMEAGKRWKGRMIESVYFERVDGKWRLAVKFQDKPKR